MATDQQALESDVDRSDKKRESLEQWWDGAQENGHTFWLSGTPGEEVWTRLKIRERLQPGTFVLNIGVGLGRCTRELAALGCNVSVLDISPRAVERVSAFARGYTSSRDLPASSFDLALSHLVIQHMIDIDVQDQIENVIRSLRPGGLFAFQYAADVNGQCSPQYRGYAKAGAIRRRPADIESIVRIAAGRMVAHFQREVHECGTQWWVAHVVRGDSGSKD